MFFAENDQPGGNSKVVFFFFFCNTPKGDLPKSTRKRSHFSDIYSIFLRNIVRPT